LSGEEYVHGEMCYSRASDLRSSALIENGLMQANQQIAKRKRINELITEK